MSSILQYKVAKKKISITGMASMGWYLGHGYVVEKQTVKTTRWTVIDTGNKDRIMAICPSELAANKIANALNVPSMISGYYDK